MSMLDQGFAAGGRCERRQLSARRAKTRSRRRGDEHQRKTAGVAADPGRRVSWSRRGETLLSARGDDLIDLCASAPRVRDSGLAAAERPAVLSYSHTVFIPLTRLRRDRCHLLHVRDHTPTG